MSTIIETIDRLCEERGIKGSKLCDDLGISRSTLTELRKGRAKSLNIKKATLIANYFDVPLAYLLGETTDTTPPQTQKAPTLSKRMSCLMTMILLFYKGTYKTYPRLTANVSFGILKTLWTFI